MKYIFALSLSLFLSFPPSLFVFTMNMYQLKLISMKLLFSDYKLVVAFFLSHPSHTFNDNSKITYE